MGEFQALLKPQRPQLGSVLIFPAWSPRSRPVPSKCPWRRLRVHLQPHKTSVSPASPTPNAACKSCPQICQAFQEAGSGLPETAKIPMMSALATVPTTLLSLSQLPATHQLSDPRAGKQGVMQWGGELESKPLLWRGGPLPCLWVPAQLGARPPGHAAPGPTCLRAQSPLLLSCTCCSSLGSSHGQCRSPGHHTPPSSPGAA